MFPSTPVANVKQNLPVVLQALVEPQLAEKPMVLMALATIRAETESFLPVTEGQSRFNTSPSGHPFDLYDNRADLGNQGPPDGARYCGRGFIQLTGRTNYQVHSAAIGLGTKLLENPEMANDPVIAARLLASFIKSKERQIKERCLLPKAISVPRASWSTAARTGWTASQTRSGSATSSSLRRRELRLRRHRVSRTG